jgi:hypothetical protein
VKDPNMLSGHGLAVPGEFVTPQDITFYCKSRCGLPNWAGNLIETGQPLPPGWYTKTYPKGSTVPEHMLLPIDPDWLAGNPTTVSDPTLLSTLVQNATGPCHWVACRSYGGKHLGPIIESNFD